MFVVYCITNTVTNKQYIGCTNQPYHRWAVHKHHGQKGTGPCSQLYKSMKKHGVDSFIFSLLEEDIETSDQAKQKEVQYIELYDTYRNGYNGTPGGTGGDMSEYETWRQANKVYLKNKPSEECATYGMLGKKHSEETKIKQAIVRKKYWDLKHGRTTA